jgi:drug/metabolite transporter (DMT)-like permease
MMPKKSRFMPANSHKKQAGSLSALHSGRSAGTLLMLASAFLFSVLDGIIKLMGPGFRIWDIAFYRFGFGLVILIGLTGWNRNPFRTRNFKLMIIRGITGTGAFLLLVMAIRLIPISNGNGPVLFLSGV